MLADVGLAIVTGEQPGDDIGYRDPALDSSMPPTAASDCFGLAALGYAALTGVPPRTASRPDVIESIVARAPWVPAPLAEVVEGALVGDASIRPDVASFGTAVLGACGAAPVRLSGPRRTTDPDAAVAMTAPQARPRSRRLVIAGVVAAILVVSALAGIVSARFNPPHASALQPPSTASGFVPDATTTPRWKDPTPWRPVVTRLLALRAKALATGRLSLLTSIYWKASFAYDMDNEALHIMRSEHLRTRGYAQRIVKLEVVDLEQGRTLLTLTTSIPPYTVVDRNGVVVARRAGRIQHFDMTIERHHHEWLIQGLDEPPLVADPPATS
jgi:hypothetical protein